MLFCIPQSAVRPSDTLLVVDAMMGQEAANLVKSFNDELAITGAILTKVGATARGGRWLLGAAVYAVRAG